MIQVKSPFFSSKNLLRIIICIFAVYLLVWSGVLIRSKHDHDRQLRNIKTEQERLKSLSKEEQSINKAQAYLVDSITIAGTTERIFLSYLQRKFELPPTLGVEGPPIDLSEDPQTYPAEVHFLARIAYPDRIVNTPPKYELDDGVKVTNIYSANCDHLPLPSNYWQTMGQNVSAGGYYLAHVALAFAFMKDNNCPLVPQADEMKTKVTEGLVQLADNPTTVADLRYESVAFLLLSGRKELVKTEWINRIIQEQHPEGGWSRQAGGDKNDPHSTILALWALLEYSRPNTPYEPLIHRPASDSNIR